MTTVSQPAGLRIGRFSLILAAAVVVIVVIGAVVTFAAQSSMYSSRGDSAPWLDDEIVRAEQDGDVFSSDRSALVVVPEELRGEPIQATMLNDDGQMQSLYRLDAEGIVISLGWVDVDLPGVFAVFDDDELWVVGDGPWQLELAPADARDFESVAQGSDDAVLVYRGDATAADVRWTGDGALFVDVVGASGWDPMVSGESSDTGGRERLMWPATPYVVFAVTVYGDVAWTLAVDEEVTR